MTAARLPATGPDRDAYNASVERATKWFTDACASRVCPVCGDVVTRLTLREARARWPCLSDVPSIRLPDDAAFFFCDGPGKAPAWTHTPDANPWHFSYVRAR